MRLRPYVADANTGGGYGAHYASGAQLGQEAAALGESARQVQLAGDAFARVDEAKREVKIKTDAAETKAALMVELEGLHSNLQATEQDPDRFLEKYRTGVEQLKGTLPNRVKYQESLELLRPDLAMLFGRDEVQARAHSNKLFVGASTASLLRTTDMYRSLAQKTPLTDTERFTGLYRDTLSAINEATWLGPEKQQAMRVKARADFTNDRATIHAAEDPEGFLAAHGRGEYGELDTAKADMLTRRAEHTITQNAQKRLAEEEHFNKEVKAAVEKEQGEHIRDLTDLLAAGNYDGFNQRLTAARGLLEPAQYEHWKDKGAKKDRITDDPDAERQLNREVYSESVSIAQAEATLTRLATKIKPETERIYRNHIEARRTRAQGKADRAEDQRLAYLKGEQQQIEQELALALPRKGAFGEDNIVNSQVLGDAIGEMARANPANGGQVTPREWFEKNKGRVLARATEARTARVVELRRVLTPYVTDGQPDVAKLEGRRGTLSDSEFYEALLRLRELKMLMQETEKVGGTVPGAPKPAASTTSSSYGRSARQ